MKCNNNATCRRSPELKFQPVEDNKFGGLSNIKAMELLDAQRAIENKDVLIGMMQEQLKKIEDKYKRNLSETEQIRYKFCIAQDRLDKIDCRQKKPCSRCYTTKLQQELEQSKLNYEKCLKAKQQEEPFVPQLKEKISSFEQIINEHYATLINLVEKISTTCEAKMTEVFYDQPESNVSILQKEMETLKEENERLKKELEQVKSNREIVEVVYENKKLVGDEASEAPSVESSKITPSESVSYVDDADSEPETTSGSFSVVGTEVVLVNNQATQKSSSSTSASHKGILLNGSKTETTQPDNVLSETGEDQEEGETTVQNNQEKETNVQNNQEEGETTVQNNQFCEAGVKTSEDSDDESLEGSMESVEPLYVDERNISEDFEMENASENTEGTFKSRMSKAMSYKSVSAANSTITITNSEGGGRDATDSSINFVRESVLKGTDADSKSKHDSQPSEDEKKSEATSERSGSVETEKTVEGNFYENVFNKQNSETRELLKEIIMNINDLRGELDRFKGAIEIIEDRTEYCMTEVEKFRGEAKIVQEDRPKMRQKTVSLSEGQFKRQSNTIFKFDKSHGVIDSAASFNVYKQAPVEESSEESNLVLAEEEPERKPRTSKSVSLSLKDGSVIIPKALINETPDLDPKLTVSESDRTLYHFEVENPPVESAPESNEIASLILKVEQKSQTTFSSVDPPPDLISYKSTADSIRHGADVSTSSSEVVNSAPDEENLEKNDLTKNWPFYTSISKQISEDALVRPSETNSKNHSQRNLSTGSAGGINHLPSAKKLKMLMQHRDDLKKERDAKNQQIETVEELLRCYAEEEQSHAADGRAECKTADDYLQFYINKVIDENGKLKSTIESLLANVKGQVDQLNQNGVRTKRTDVQEMTNKECQTCVCACACSDRLTQFQQTEEVVCSCNHVDQNDDDECSCGRTEQLEFMPSCLVCMAQKVRHYHRNDRCQTSESGDTTSNESESVHGQNVATATLVRSLENYIQELIDHLDASKKIDDDIASLKGHVSAKNW